MAAFCRSESWHSFSLSWIYFTIFLVKVWVYLLHPRRTHKERLGISERWWYHGFSNRFEFVLSDFEKNTRKWGFFALKWVQLKNGVNYIFGYLDVFYLGCAQNTASMLLVCSCNWWKFSNHPCLLWERYGGPFVVAQHSCFVCAQTWLQNGLVLVFLNYSHFVSMFCEIVYVHQGHIWPAPSSWLKGMHFSFLPLLKYLVWVVFCWLDSKTAGLINTYLYKKIKWLHNIYFLLALIYSFLPMSLH